MSLTDDELKAMRERCEAATPGLWRADPCWSNVYMPPDELVTWTFSVSKLAGQPPPKYVATHDKQFIAHARADLPRCLDEIADLKRRLAEAESANSAMDFIKQSIESGKLLDAVTIARKERDEALAKLAEAEQAREHAELVADQAVTAIEVAEREIPRVLGVCSWRPDDDDMYAGPWAALHNYLRHGYPADVARQLREKGTSRTIDLVAGQRDEALAKLAEAEKDLHHLRVDDARAIQRILDERNEARAEAAAAHAKIKEWSEGWHLAESEWQERAEKATAEAAALRAAIRREVLDDAHEEDWPGLVEALSQPGPGAAYQERVRKLEALAAEVRRYRELLSPSQQADACIETIGVMLAALEEKP